MSPALKKYLPWAVAIILAMLSAYLGTQTPDVPRSEPVFVTVRDTAFLRDTVTLRIRDRVTVVVNDSVRSAPDSLQAVAGLERLRAERDSLNREILRLGETRADIDTMITLPIGDSSHVEIRACAMHEIERGYTTISLILVKAVLVAVAECPDTAPWGWITSAATAVAAVLAVVLK